VVSDLGQRDGLIGSRQRLARIADEVPPGLLDQRRNTGLGTAPTRCLRQRQRSKVLSERFQRFAS